MKMFRPILPLKQVDLQYCGISIVLLCTIQRQILYFLLYYIWQSPVTLQMIVKTKYNQHMMY